MTITRRAAGIGGLSLVASAAVGGLARADWGGDLTSLGEGMEEFWLATDAYIYLATRLNPPMPAARRVMVIQVSSLVRFQAQDVILGCTECGSSGWRRAGAVARVVFCQVRR